MRVWVWVCWPTATNRYDLTGEKIWLDGGLALAERLAGVYFDGALPRGAAGIDWYESQMGPSFLQHGLALLALEWGRLPPRCRLHGALR